MKMIRITNAALMEDGKQVLSKTLDIECELDELESVRRSVKADMVQEVSKDSEVYLQYQEVEG